MSQNPISRYGEVKLEFCRRLHDSWEEAADLFGIEVHDTRGWPKGKEPRRLWEWLEERHELDRLPEVLTAVGRDDLAGLVATLPTKQDQPAVGQLLEDDSEQGRDLPNDASGLPTGSGRRFRRKMLILSCAVAALVGSSTVAVVYYASRSALTYTSRSTPTYVKLRPASPAPTRQWIDKLDCARQTQWVHTFPPGYVGDVYVQITADPQQTVLGMVTLLWGGLTWSNSIEIRPGDVSHYLGGTLLLFQKRDVDHSAPIGVVFTSKVPVCAVFGTAVDPVRTAPLLVVPTPHWIPVSK